MQSGSGGPSLAINGGQRQVGGRLPMLVQRLGYGLQRCWDLYGAFPLMIRGITTIADGSETVGTLEQDFRELTGCEHALAVTNGTAALHSAYFALGVGHGTEVIVPSYTWHASATPILLCGAVPVFCEMDPRTLTLDPDDVERRITERTRAITAVHVWGNPAPMDRIREIADRHGLGVVEDCSHAHGALYQGKPVGSWGDVGCFSLQAAKTVEGGECGVATTDDPALFDRMLLLGHNGRLIYGQKADSFDVGNTSLGLKYRPHMLATVLGHASAKRLPSRNRAAAATWDFLCDELADQPALRPIPTTEGGTRGGFYAFVFEYRGADMGGPSTAEFVEAVAAEGAPLQRDQYVGSLPHQTPLFRDLDRRELGGAFYDPTRPWDENRSTAALPITEAMSERLVRLPPELRGTSRSYVRRCVAAIKKVLAATVPATGSEATRATAGDAAEPPLQAAPPSPHARDDLRSLIAMTQGSCAVVLGGATAGIAIIQELAHYGVSPIYLLDRVPRDARHSRRLAGVRIVEPGAAGLRDALVELHRSHERIVLFPTFDDHLEDLEEHYDELAPFCHLPFNRAHLRRDLDKIHQYQDCERLGVPCPRTTFVRDAADLDQLDGLPLPMLVKPQEKTPLARPRLVEDPAELPDVKATIRDHLGQGVQYLASEFVPGEGSNVHAYVGHRTPEGEILNEWIGKKLSQYPDDLGVFASASNQCPEEVLALGRRLVEGMDLHGIAEPEFKYDARDGKFKLMEVNLRSMGWVGVGHLSGVPLHYSQWLYATGQPVPRFEQERQRDLRLIQIQSEVTNLLRRPGYGRIFRSVFGRCDKRTFTYFDWRDPLPFLAQMRQLVLVTASEIFDRLRGRGGVIGERPEAA